MRRKLVFVLTLFVCLLSLLYVRFDLVEVTAPDGTGPVHNLNTGYNYTTIQGAIDANETLDGHVIFVEEGMYYEHVFVGKELTLIGENRDTTIIDGNGTGVVVELRTNVTLINFTVRNGEYGVKIWDYGSTPVYKGNTVNNNKIMDNLFGAILLRGCTNNTVTNNIITSNNLFGIHLWHACNNTIINNTIINNSHGIDFYGNSNDNVLRNNNMTHNEYNFGLILREETRMWLYYSPSKPGIFNDVDPSNTVNGKPIYYLVNRSDEQVPSDAGYVWLNNCTNITINGCDLSNNLQGILLLLANNISIINNTITNNAYGIYVGILSSNNTLIGNTLENNLNGIYLGDLSKITTMKNNNIHNSQMNFGVDPDIMRHTKDGSELINDIDISNNVDGKPIVYWINQHNKQVPENAGYVILINSTNILIESLNLSNNVQNIFLLASNDTVIRNNSITNSVYGIDVSDYYWFDYNTSTFHGFSSFNTTIEGNMLVNNGVGIRLRSNNSTVSNNTLYRNPLGIYLKGVSKCTILRNMVMESDMNLTYPSPDMRIFYYPEWLWERSIELSQLLLGGIISGSYDSVVYGNTVANSKIGISTYDQLGLYWGTGNIIFNNNIINNTDYQAIGWRDNYWDGNYPSGGNFWSHYNGTDFFSGPYQDEIGSDAIGDEEFLVFSAHEFEVDHYPLMAPISIFDAGTWNGIHREILVISNSTISNFQLNETQKTISFNVTGETGFGFCRVTIPNVIVQEYWQDNYTVLINGQPIESRNWTDESNTYIYFAYQHSTCEVIIVPEFPAFFTMSLLMMATLLTSIVHRRKPH